MSGLAAASIALPSVILAVFGVVVGLLLTLVTGRFELHAKREYLGTLRAMGWNPDMLGQSASLKMHLSALWRFPWASLVPLDWGCSLLRTQHSGPDWPGCWP